MLSAIIILNAIHIIFTRNYTMASIHSDENSEDHI